MAGAARATLAEAAGAILAGAAGAILAGAVGPYLAAPHLGKAPSAGTLLAGAAGAILAEVARAHLTCAQLTASRRLQLADLHLVREEEEVESVTVLHLVSALQVLPPNPGR